MDDASRPASQLTGLCGAAIVSSAEGVFLIGSYDPDREFTTFQSDRSSSSWIHGEGTWFGAGALRGCADLIEKSDPLYGLAHDLGKESGNFVLDWVANSQRRFVVWSMDGRQLHTTGGGSGGAHILDTGSRLVFVLSGPTPDCASIECLRIQRWRYRLTCDA